MNTESNIKSRVRYYFTNPEKPNMSIQEYNQLKATMSTSDFKLSIGDVIKTEDGGNFKVTNIKIEVLEEEMDGHLKYGIETALVGTHFPYNFEVEVFLSEI